VEGGGRPPVTVVVVVVELVVGGGATTTTCFFEDGNSNRRPTAGVGGTYPATNGVPGGKFGFVRLLLEEGKSLEIEMGGGPPADDDDDDAAIIPVVPSSLLVLLLLRAVDAFLVADAAAKASSIWEQSISSVGKLKVSFGSREGLFGCTVGNKSDDLFFIAEAEFARSVFDFSFKRRNSALRRAMASSTIPILLLPMMGVGALLAVAATAVVPVVPPPPPPPKMGGPPLEERGGPPARSRGGGGRCSCGGRCCPALLFDSLTLAGVFPPLCFFVAAAAVAGGGEPLCFIKFTCCIGLFILE